MTNWPIFNTDINFNDVLTLIDSHAVLEISGEDAVKFLQGQCSADIDSLKIGASVPGAICTVKGRVVTSFIVCRQAASLLLLMPRDLVAVTAEYLTKYAAFFKVDLLQWTHPCVAANTADLKTEGFTPCNYQLGEHCFADGLLNAQQSQQLIEKLESDEIHLSIEAQWLDRLVSAGWIVLNKNTTEQYLPHPLNLDRLGAISFTKGCYTGQEIIARTEYRGKSKRRIHCLKLSGLELKKLQLPTELINTESGNPAGELITLSADGSLGLALISIETPTNGDFLINGTKISYQIPQ